MVQFGWKAPNELLVARMSPPQPKPDRTLHVARTSARMAWHAVASLKRTPADIRLCIGLRYGSCPYERPAPTHQDCRSVPIQVALSADSPAKSLSKVPSPLIKGMSVRPKVLATSSTRKCVVERSHRALVAGSSSTDVRDVGVGPCQEFAGSE